MNSSVTYRSHVEFHPCDKKKTKGCSLERTRPRIAAGELAYLEMDEKFEKFPALVVLFRHHFQHLNKKRKTERKTSKDKKTAETRRIGPWSCRGLWFWRDPVRSTTPFRFLRTCIYETPFSRPWLIGIDIARRDGRRGRRTGRRSERSGGRRATRDAADNGFIGGGRRRVVRRKSETEKNRGPARNGAQ